MLDALIVPELESVNSYELVQTAQDGVQVMCALRASSAADALRRLELCSLQANVALNAAEHRERIAQSFRFVLFMDRMPKSGRRHVREVTEIVGIDSGKYKLEPLMRWNEKTEKLERTERTSQWVK